jgi:hypothetical protein
MALILDRNNDMTVTDRLPIPIYPPESKLQARGRPLESHREIEPNEGISGKRHDGARDQQENGEVEENMGGVLQAGDGPLAQIEKAMARSRNSHTVDAPLLAKSMQGVPQHNNVPRNCTPASSSTSTETEGQLEHGRYSSASIRQGDYYQRIGRNNGGNWGRWVNRTGFTEEGGTALKGRMGRAARWMGEIIRRKVRRGVGP